MKDFKWNEKNDQLVWNTEYEEYWPGSDKQLLTKLEPGRVKLDQIILAMSRVLTELIEIEEDRAKRRFE